MKSYLAINYLCPIMARIHAHISGDGNMYIKMEKTSPRNLRLGMKPRFARHILEYTNTHFLFLDNFQKYIQIIAPKTYIYRDYDRIQIRNELLYELMKKWGAGGTFEWHVPKEIFSNSLLRRH